MAGDVSLVPLMLEAERRRMPPEEVEEALSRILDCSSPFISMPL